MKRQLKPRIIDHPPDRKTALLAFAEELRTWRKKKMDWSQERAASHLGVTLRAYENWEQALCPPRFPDAIRKLMKIARPRGDA